MMSALRLGPGVMAPSRTNGFLNMLETMRKRTVMLTEQLPRFPSLTITADEISPQGSFAEAQAQYLAPNAAEVDALVKVCVTPRKAFQPHGNACLCSHCTGSTSWHMLNGTESLQILPWHTMYGLAQYVVVAIYHQVASSGVVTVLVRLNL